MKHLPSRPVVSTVVAALALTLAGCNSAAKSGGGGKSNHVTIAVGGQSQVVYLPTTLAQQLGYYKDAGLDVSIQDFKGGSKAAEAVIGGSADVVSGFYDHNIEFAAKGQPTRAFILMLKYPDLVLAVAPKKAKDIRSISDLKGKTVGVTAPGSSTDFFVKYLMVKNGKKATDISVTGIGAAASAVAAMEQGKVDAAVMVDPAISVLQKRAGNVPILVDTRSGSGVQEAFGSTTYPASVLYAKQGWVDSNKDTVTKLVKAISRTVSWMLAHTPQEIADRMPKEFAGDDPAVYVTAIKNALPSYSKDGLLEQEGAEAVKRVLSTFEPEVKQADVDVTKTYTNSFVQQGS